MGKRCDLLRPRLVDNDLRTRSDGFDHGCLNGRRVEGYIRLRGLRNDRQGLDYRFLHRSGGSRQLCRFDWFLGGSIAQIGRKLAPSGKILVYHINVS